MSEPSRQRPSLPAAIGASWALLLGFGILELGDGLQGTLLAVRAAREGFPTTITGLVMSTFFVGFLLGSIHAPRIVERVGHTRVFAAMASIASAAILVHSVFVHPATWAALRLVSGFCFAGIYVVAESWLNDRASNDTRGQILSVYMVITYLGVGCGQLLLNLADPLGPGLFILTSVLISLALVPLLLSAGPAPRFETLEPVNLTALYRISPLGVVGAAAVGVTSAAFFGMGPVYASDTGLSVREVSLFMTAAVAGCVGMQWPIGHLSDLLDRRVVICLVTLAAAAVCVVLASTTTGFGITLVLVTAFGGLSLPLYSLSIAHANDFLEPEQMVAASGGLVLASGVGAIIGPLGASVAMDELGPGGLFLSLAGIHALLGLFALYRMARRPARPLAEQGPHIPTSARPSQGTVTVELIESSRRQQPADDRNGLSAPRTPRSSDDERR